MTQQQEVQAALAAFGDIARRARASHVVSMRDLEQGLVAYRAAIRANSADTLGGCLDKVVAPVIDTVLTRFRAQPHLGALKTAVDAISKKTMGVVATVAVLDGSRKGLGLPEAASNGLGTLLCYADAKTLSDLSGKPIGIPRSHGINRGGADL